MARIAIFGTCKQGRPLADWTDCFQSGPAPKGASRYAYELTLSIESVCVVLARGPQYLLSMRSVENHRKQKWTVPFLNVLNLHIRSLIVTTVIVFRQYCSLSFFSSGRKDKVLKLCYVSVTSFSYLSTLKKPSKNYTCFISRRFGIFLIHLQSKNKAKITFPFFVFGRSVFSSCYKIWFDGCCFSTVTATCLLKVKFSS